MPEIERGRTFIDFESVSFNKKKPKFFITMNDADYDDDILVCFVMNSEKQREERNLSYNCNRLKGKFVIQEGVFSFITHDTSIMLKTPNYLKLEYIIGGNTKLYEIAPELIQRQIKNCLDFGYIQPQYAELIKKSFKRK